MLSSLYSSVTGLNAAGYTMSVISNNIANSNTVGFKSDFASFADILSQSLGGIIGGNQIGRGVNLSDIGTIFSQGSFENITSPTDLAIEGAGFFIVADSTGTYYTRAGQFVMDEEGYLVNSGGFRLQGYMADETGTLLSTVGDINIAQTSSAPQQTNDLRIVANLDGQAATDDTYSSTITVYDSIGGAIPLTITFTKLAAGNEWGFEASVLGTATGDTGTVGFDANGNLESLDGNTTFSDVSIDVPGANGGSFTVSWDLWDDTASAAMADLTGYASPSNTSALFQDGYAPGSVQNVSVDQDGQIIGLFSNGQTRTLGQVLLADFISPWGLTKMGRSLYAESASSGQPTVGEPGTGGRGQISPNSLEMSNVDMASEFVTMITAQRAYQANARVITSSNEMLSELMNIAR
ncbi:MAG: flagellar hook protein FlgE [Deltaproteobacteria bacterium]|nr:flagellar hook protein FlgE [Deltaproteobacteria bacterium]